MPSFSSWEPASHSPLVGRRSGGTQHLCDWVDLSNLKSQLISPFALIPSCIFQPLSPNCEVLASICLILCLIFQIVQNSSVWSGAGIYWRSMSPLRVLAGNSVSVGWINE